jgi:hypothetical protein
MIRVHPEAYTVAMDLEDFVKDVLAQVTRAVNDNKAGGKTSYHVASDDGVQFDLAVTTADKSTESTGQSENAETKGLPGGLKVKVIGSESSVSKSNETTDERTSRVKFKVNVYTAQDFEPTVSSGGGTIFDPSTRY